MKREHLNIILISKIFLLVWAICLFSSCGNITQLMSKSGTLLIIEVKTDEPNIDQVTDQAVKVLQNRLNALGVNGEVEKTVANRLEVKIYGDADVQRIKKILLAESRFELRKVVSPPSPAPMQTYPTKEAAIQSLGGTVADNRKVLPYAGQSDKTGQWIIVENPPIVDGRDLRDAEAVNLGGSESYQIHFSLTQTGAQKFGNWTGKNINNYLAVVLNDEVKSAAYIKSQIFDSGVIDGRFTKQSAEDLALVMKSGYLPASFQLVDEKKFE